MAAPNETPGQAARIVAKRIGVQEARSRFAELIGQIHDDGEAVIIERAGAPVVAMMPIELFDRLLAQPGVVDASSPPSLFGAFPELAALDDDDLEMAKGIWEAGLEKQGQILQENH
jgi:prevent-host-death family protein